MEYILKYTQRLNERFMYKNVTALFVMKDNRKPLKYPAKGVQLNKLWYIPIL